MDYKTNTQIITVSGRKRIPGVILTPFQRIVIIQNETISGTMLDICGFQVYSAAFHDFVLKMKQIWTAELDKGDRYM